MNSDTGDNIFIDRRWPSSSRWSSPEWSASTRSAQTVDDG